jgi:hypothetical protein
MRSDYCPLGNEPCQSLCDKPCSAHRLKAITPQPQRPWVGLTDEEIKKFWRDATVKPCYTSELIDTFARAIEAKLKEKNT